MKIQEISDATTWPTAHLSQKGQLRESQVKRTNDGPE